MPTTATTRYTKLVAAGNTRGVRLPRELVRKYGISDVLAQEDWSDRDGVATDGLAASKW
jgi:hypothetical protein